MTDLVTFGETMLRLSPSGDERLETADEYEVYVGGAESNVAVTAQRLGLDAAWTSKLPDLPTGRKVAREVRNHGVTVDVAWDEEGRVGTYYLEAGQSPRGTEVIYDRAHASVTTASPDELPVEMVEESEAFHTTGITPALSGTLADTTETLLSVASDADTLTSFDCNYRSKLWSGAEARETLESLLPTVDVFVVAERDAANVLDRSGDAKAIARDLAEEYEFEVTIVTRSDRGVLALADDAVYEQSTFEATDAYPVGTGDAFVGGFLARYVPGGDVPGALEYGAATAALKRSIPGDVAVVTPGEVDAVVAGGSADISR